MMNKMIHDMFLMALVQITNVLKRIEIIDSAKSQRHVHARCNMPYLLIAFRPQSCLQSSIRSSDTAF